MDKFKVRDLLIDAILKEKPLLNEEDILDTDNLADDLGLDSLDVVEIIMIMEKHLNIIIEDDIAESVKAMTVGGFYEKLYSLTL
jgi:acyl carrier protein